MRLLFKAGPNSWLQDEGFESLNSVLILLRKSIKNLAFKRVQKEVEHQTKHCKMRASLKQRAFGNLV